MDEYLTVKDIMRVLKISRTLAYGYIRSRRLKSFKVGRLVRIKAEDLERFIEGRPTKKNSQKER
jgi:excisionase family DNA binding protein